MWVGSNWFNECHRYKTKLGQVISKGNSRDRPPFAEAPACYRAWPTGAICHQKSVVKYGSVLIKAFCFAWLDSSWPQFNTCLRYEFKTSILIVFIENHVTPITDTILLLYTRISYIIGRSWIRINAVKPQVNTQQMK